MLSVEHEPPAQEPLIVIAEPVWCLPGTGRSSYRYALACTESMYIDRADRRGGVSLMDMLGIGSDAFARHVG